MWHRVSTSLLRIRTRPGDAEQGCARRDTPLLPLAPISRIWDMHNVPLPEMSVTEGKMQPTPRRCCCSWSFISGLQLSISALPLQYIQRFMNETWLERTGTPLGSDVILLLWSFTVSAYPLGGLTGAIAAGPMAIMLGRKTSLLLNNVFVIIAAVLSGFSRMAKSFEMIILSRFFTGLNAGISMNIQPMYLAESAPKKLRGAVALTSASFTALGLLVGQVVGLRELLGAENSWPLLLASNAVPALIQLMALPWFPESPRYLLIDRGDKESCISALQKLRGHCDLSAELEEMLAEQAATHGQRPKKPWELFQDRAVRWQLLSIVVLSSAMQLCGNDSVRAPRRPPSLRTAFPPRSRPRPRLRLTPCKLLHVLICFHTRSCLLVFNIILTIELISSPFLFPAGVTGVLPTEVFDQMSRPAAYVICGSLLWFNLFLVGTAFPFIVVAHFCYVPFFLVCICTALYVGFFLPETKGKSFLEISEEFKKRNFKSHAHAFPYKGPEEIKSTVL
uniref:Solute carrier family 2, facilitated glucose transporter member 11-like n=1 Tax=Nothoprocta perdicaria TaxID=30464 RepID=A0A8C6ZB08_NOTPE